VGEGVVELYEADCLLVTGLEGAPWRELVGRELILNELSAQVLEACFFERARPQTHAAAALALVGHELLDGEAEESEGEGTVGGAALDPVNAVLTFLRANLAESLTSESIASAVGVSRSQLVETFRRAGRKTPVKELAELRAERARELLQLNELTIAQIGAAVGYRDAAAFNHFFKKHTGLSPKGYRDEVLWIT
jgi:transcriptional regulator GlxA family with amidase domain